MSMKDVNQEPDGYLSKMPILQFSLLSLLFPLWAAAASLNDILITQFKSVFYLSNFASALVQSAFYGGYFLIAIPASLLIKKKSYKLCILFGLVFYIIGCSLFYPASSMATYSMFLVAIFVLAIGLSFLETSANTYSTLMGPRNKSTLRLNISQTLYPIGSIVGILLGQYLIFQNGASLKSKMSTMSPKVASAFVTSVLKFTLQPYKYLILILIVVFVLFAITKFPKCKPQNGNNELKTKASISETLKYLSKNSDYKKGILAQFIYIGLQTTVWSFTIRLALTLNKNIGERSASTYMIYTYIAFFLGRLLATFLMSKIDGKKVLFIYSLLGCLTLIYVTLAPNFTAVYACIVSSFFFGPCWATIYGETLRSVKNKKYTETAGAIIIMAIVGGAFLPAVQGLVSDNLGSMQLSFVVPMICFAFVALYFYTQMKMSKRVTKSSKLN